MLIRSSKIFSPSFVFPPGSRIHASAFFGISGVEAKRQVAEQIGNRLRLENYRIESGIDSLCVATVESLSNRLACDTLCIQSGDVVMAAEKIAGACPVRRSCRHRKTDIGRLFELKVAVLRRRSPSLQRVRSESPPPISLFVSHSSIMRPMLLARFGSDRFAVASTITIYRLVGLLRQRRHVFAVNRSSRAIFSACSTIAFRLASSRSLVEDVPRLPSIQTVTFAPRLTRWPLVRKSLFAKRRCDCLLLLTLAVASSAVT